MPVIHVDDIKFVTTKPTLDSSLKLAKELEKEFKVKVTFLKKLSSKAYHMAFVLHDCPNQVFFMHDLSEKAFNYSVFHEIRHILQERSKMFILSKNRVYKGADVVRFLFDCISCEMDADIYAIRECASRRLPYTEVGYLGWSKKKWHKLVMRYAKEQCADYKVTHKQVNAIVSLLVDPMRLRKR